MKKLALFIILTAVLGLNITVAYRILTNEPTPVVTQPTIVPVTHPVASEVAQLVNAERVKYGLSPLVEDARLDASASEKCADEVRLNEWGHNLSDGTNAGNFINKQFTNNHLWAENLTWGWDDSALVVSKWMHSPSHRAAILNSDYSLVGYAVCGTSTYDNMVVQHFVGE